MIRDLEIRLQQMFPHTNHKPINTAGLCKEVIQRHLADLEDALLKTHPTFSLTFVNRVVVLQRP